MSSFFKSIGIDTCRIKPINKLEDEGINNYKRFAEIQKERRMRSLERLSQKYLDEGTIMRVTEDFDVSYIAEIAEKHDLQCDCVKNKKKFRNTPRNKKF